MTKSIFGRLAAAIVMVAGPGGLADVFAGPKPTTYTPVPLVVTVEDRLDAQGNLLFGISSDGDGEYVHGAEGVTANFDAYGNLIIAFNANPYPTPRKLRFVYDSPLAPGAEDRPPTAKNSYLSTQFKFNAPGLPTWPLQNMPVPSVQCIQATFQFTDTDSAKTMYRTLYRRPLAGEDGADTSYLVVTRLDQNTWEVEPKFDAGCNPAHETVARLYSNRTRGNGAVTAWGAFHMPFKMMLVRQ